MCTYFGWGSVYFMPSHVVPFIWSLKQISFMFACNFSKYPTSVTMLGACSYYTKSIDKNSQTCFHSMRGICLLQIYIRLFGIIGYQWYHTLLYFKKTLCR
jgi:hypothetical protein